MYVDKKYAHTHCKIYPFPWKRPEGCCAGATVRCWEEGAIWYREVEHQLGMGVRSKHTRSVKVAGRFLRSFPSSHVVWFGWVVFSMKA